MQKKKKEFLILEFFIDILTFRDEIYDTIEK
jgi:hypothetical protein